MHVFELGLAAIVAACSGGGGGPGVADAGPAASADADPLCEVPVEGPEPAKWTAEIAFDTVLGTTASNFPGVLKVFAEVDGFAVFTPGALFRTDLSGQSAVEFPYPVEAGLFQSVARGDDGYLALFRQSSDAGAPAFYLCPIPGGGAVVFADCKQVDGQGNSEAYPVWNGQAFLMSNFTDVSETIRTFDASGALVASQEVLPRMLGAQVAIGGAIGDEMILHLFGNVGSESCSNVYSASASSSTVATLPQSLLPERFVHLGGGGRAASPAASLLILPSACAPRKSSNSCVTDRSDESTFVARTTFSGDVSSSAARLKQGPLVVAWDGRWFAALDFAPQSTLSLIDEKNHVAATVDMPGNWGDPFSLIYAQAAMEAVTQEDYVVGYTLRDEFRLMRIRVVPPIP